MNILIICGESSANTYGGALAKALQQKGHHMISIGNHHLGQSTEQWLTIDSTQHSVSLFQWIKKQQLKRQIQNCLHGHQTRIDHAIIIDFPSFNFVIAKTLQSQNIPISTFITPNFWMWKNQKLGKRLAQYSQNIITIYQEEYEFYKKIAPQKTHYWGHPLSLESITQTTPPTDSFVLGLFPGSRQSEVRYHLPQMLAIANQLTHHNIQSQIICNHPSLTPLIKKLVIQYHATCTIKNSSKPNIHFAISAPGTNTLKLCLHHIPMVILGCIHPIQYVLARYLFNIQLAFIGLPNIILKTPAFGEYIQPTKKDHQRIIQSIIQYKQNEIDYTDTFHQIFNAIQAPTHFYDLIADRIHSTD